MKTDRQTVLELQRCKPIVEILRDELERTRGKKFQVALVAFDLGVTDATVYKWCEAYGINIDDYRRPAAAPSSEDGEEALAKGPAHG